uniref:Uncharacterized protein n=1 Tax=Myoviridae sp. ct9dX1 TaxID=2827665 RepID=A0A8S5TJ83_9CAUD|nr:MAG TPA: hypothetical protein [Myoviridae sp. ct9dX1]
MNNQVILLELKEGKLICNLLIFVPVSVALD